VLQTCTGPVTPILSAQAGIRLDAANPATVNEAVFKNLLREPLAIEVLSFSTPAEMSFGIQPNSIIAILSGQMAPRGLLAG
jgi:hypothetical protein